MIDANTKLIQEQNDTARRELLIPKSLKTVPCIAHFSSAIVNRFDNVMEPIVVMVRDYDDFKDVQAEVDATEDGEEPESNDPYKEHDFGVLDYKGERIFFKFDYYDCALEYGSENPADLSNTVRSLTIMLASDY